MSEKLRNLHKARKKQDLTQEELAMRLGISRLKYLEIENGYSEPKISLAFKISNLFGETVEYLFKGEGGERIG